jgi:hypothetical protein
MPSAWWGRRLPQKADPVSNLPAGVLQRPEPMPVRALLFQGSNRALDHAVVLGALLCDEFLAQSILSDQARKASAAQHNPVVGS